MAFLKCCGLTSTEYCWFRRLQWPDKNYQLRCPSVCRSGGAIARTETPRPVTQILSEQQMRTRVLGAATSKSQVGRADVQGWININHNVSFNVNPAKVLRALLGGDSRSKVSLQTPTCPALNHTGSLVAKVQVENPPACDLCLGLGVGVVDLNAGGFDLSATA